LLVSQPVVSAGNQPGARPRRRQPASTNAQPGKSPYLELKIDPAALQTKTLTVLRNDLARLVRKALADRHHSVAGALHQAIGDIDRCLMQRGG
jgi:hypothetical protein